MELPVVACGLDHGRRRGVLPAAGTPLPAVLDSRDDGQPAHRRGALPQRCPSRERARRGDGALGLTGPAGGAGVIRLRILIRACRPRQWTKNILVLTAPIAAGVAFQPRVAVQMVVAVIAFGLASVSYTHLRAHETRHDLVCR